MTANVIIQLLDMQRKRAAERAGEARPESPRRSFLKKVIKNLQERIDKTEQVGTGEALRGGFFLRTELRTVQQALDYTGGRGTIINAEDDDGHQTTLFIADVVRSEPGSGIYNSSGSFARQLLQSDVGATFESPVSGTKLKIKSISQE